MTTILERPVDYVEAERIDVLATYPVTHGQIAELHDKYSGLDASTPKGLELCRTARAEIRTLRVSVEKQREMLKRRVLDEGRRIDSTAKLLTAELEKIETPIDAMIKEVEAKKAKEKADKEAAEKAAIEAKVKAERDAEEARLKATRDAEEAKLREERARLEADRLAMEAKQKAIDEANRVEREKVEAERRRVEQEAAARQAKIDAENAAKQKAAEEAQRIAREKIEAERMAVEAERQKVEAQRQAQERAEFERQARIKAESELKAKAERDRLEAEESRIREYERTEAERLRMEAIKPDVSKVHEFANQLRLIKWPSVKSNEANACLTVAAKTFKAMLKTLDDFNTEPTS